MTETLRTCWAISAALKSRCDMPAGHPGEHSITVSWSDDQCWSPESDEPIHLEVVKSDIVSPAVDKPSKPEACVACGHMHKSNDCQCGCYEHI